MPQFLTNPFRLANRFLMVAPLFLCGCTLGPWEKDFWHPPAAHGAAPIADGPTHPIPRATGDNLQKWPKLGTVPERPAPPATAAEIAAQTNALEADRAAAAAPQPATASPAQNTGDPDIPVAPSPPPALPDD